LCNRYRRAQNRKKPKGFIPFGFLLLYKTPAGCKRAEALAKAGPAGESVHHHFFSEASEKNWNKIALTPTVE